MNSAHHNHQETQQKRQEITVRANFQNQTSHITSWRIVSSRRWCGKNNNDPVVFRSEPHSSVLAVIQRVRILRLCEVGEYKVWFQVGNTCRHYDAIFSGGYVETTVVQKLGVVGELVFSPRNSISASGVAAVLFLKLFSYLISHAFSIFVLCQWRQVWGSTVLVDTIKKFVFSISCRSCGLDIFVRMPKMLGGGEIKWSSQPGITVLLSILPCWKKSAKLLTCNINWNGRAWGYESVQNCMPTVILIKKKKTFSLFTRIQVIMQNLSIDK